MKSLRHYAILLCISALCARRKPSKRPPFCSSWRTTSATSGSAFTQATGRTPNLDRLRARGTTFERAYVQYPVCNPSRSSVLTGWRAEQTGVTGNDTPLRVKRPDIVTMPQLCKDAGWQSHAFRKTFHLVGGRDPKKKAQWIDSGTSWHGVTAY